MGGPSKYSKEVRERAIRMVLEHQEQYDSQWAAICSIAEKLGCSTEALRRWVRQAERDQGWRTKVVVIAILEAKGRASPRGIGASTGRIRCRPSACRRRHRAELRVG
jgi:transposase-like protein